MINCVIEIAFLYSRGIEVSLEVISPEPSIMDLKYADDVIFFFDSYTNQ